MIKSRIFQGLRYIFLRYNKKNDILLKKILNEEEFILFSKMSDYDKIHSIRLYNYVCDDKILKNYEIYKKLALLHDCGKENINLFKRILKVLTKNKFKEHHEIKSFEKLKNINLELANLAKIHHEKTNNKLMKRFQNLDDKA